MAETASTGFNLPDAVDAFREAATGMTGSLDKLKTAIAGATMQQLETLLSNIKGTEPAKELQKTDSPLRRAFYEEALKARSAERSKTHAELSKNAIPTQLHLLAQHVEDRIKANYQELYRQFPELQNSASSAGLQGPLAGLAKYVPAWLAPFFSQSQGDESLDEKIMGMALNVPLLGGFLAPQLAATIIRKRLGDRFTGNVTGEMIATFAAGKENWAADLRGNVNRIKALPVSGPVTWADLANPADYEQKTRSTERNTEIAARKAEMLKEFPQGAARAQSKIKDIQFGSETSATRGADGKLIVTLPSEEKNRKSAAKTLGEAIDSDVSKLHKITIVTGQPLTFKSNGKGDIDVELPEDQTQRGDLNEFAKLLATDDLKSVRKASFGNNVGGSRAPTNIPLVEVIYDADNARMIWNTLAGRDLKKMINLRTDNKAGTWQYAQGSDQWIPFTA